MIEWLWLLFGGPILALILRRLLRVPYRPKLLHTPYARPGILHNFCINISFTLLFMFQCKIGPWHYLKIISGRIWLAWKLVRHPRVLNVFDTTSKKYEKVGLVATELEKLWELPHELKNREVYIILTTKTDILTNFYTLQSVDELSFFATDGVDCFLKISIVRRTNRQAQISLLLTLTNGTTYELPGLHTSYIAEQIDSQNAS